MLKIGQIEYANCTPLFSVLRESFSCSGYQFIPGVPAKLNRMLRMGEIDVCPSSSFEYALHSEQYRILPGLSISSVGNVASVLLFSKVPIENLAGQKIMLSSESATSVNLLKLLLEQRYEISCRYEVAGTHTSIANDDTTALLLIGDAALRTAGLHPDLFVYDLGELWYSWTGYPFVFALWLCRKEVADTPELVMLAQQLIHARAAVPERLEDIVSQAHEVHWMGRERLLSYWRDNISYQLDSRARHGLLLYYTKCFESGLIADMPDLHFVTLPDAMGEII